MRNMMLVALIGVGLAATAAIAETSRVIGERQVRRVLRQAFPAAPPDWQARLVPDATMMACAHWHNQPPKAVADDIKAREATRIRHPADGNYLGDWRRGEALAQSGYGLRFTDADAKRSTGGNCYACHELSPAEVSYGTIGISLKSYGRLRSAKTEEARHVYEKIYNSQAVVPCSLMPRFGANGLLTIEQIKDLVALLLDPESPVNRDGGQAVDNATTGKNGGAPTGAETGR